MKEKQEEDGAKNPSKFTPEAQQENVDKHSNKSGQTVESPTIIKMISQFRNEREPMAIRTSEIGNKNSLQYGCLDNPKDIELFNQKSLLRDHPRTTHRLLSDGGSDETSSQKMAKTSIFQEKSHRINQRESQRHQD